MNAWWWVPIGLVAWFAVSVAWDCGSAGSQALLTGARLEPLGEMQLGSEPRSIGSRHLEASERRHRG